MIPKISSVSPVMFIVWQIAAIIQGLIFGLLVPSTQNFFDRASDFAIHGTGLSSLILGLVVLGLMQVRRNIVNGIVHFLRGTYYQRAEGFLSFELHKKISKIAPISFEDTDMLDSINKAIQGKSDVVLFIGILLNTITFHLFYFMTISIYLFTVKPLLVVSIVFVFVPTMVTHIFRSKLFLKAEDKSAPIRRELDYYEACISGREYLKETRILGAYLFFKEMYLKSLFLINKISFRASIKSNLIELGLKIVSLSGYLAILFLLTDSILAGSISTGAFVAIFSSLSALFSKMEDLVSNSYGNVARNFGKVQNYLKFLQIPEQIDAECELKNLGDITLSNISFSYPGTTKTAIDNVSLIIKNGETIALVGENGSGKSTLVKLIIGMYKSNKGNISYSDFKISDNKILPTDVLNLTSAVFQKYQRYQMTLRENINISSNENGSSTDTSLNEACTQAGFNIVDKLTDGYETMLSREFGGIDLSGGQWQRIAIARGFYRPHQLVILDEPTAAIDPIEETDLYNRFTEISINKTAVVVTHRIGSVKLADRILVMKNGQLVEQGIHSALIAVGGEYARLYKMQEQWYQ